MLVLLKMHDTLTILEDSPFSLERVNIWLSVLAHRPRR